jgi:alkanesulfonate monooxygenase SsuD/methylene tetrahydromethanopterin reductase-like flavin-dependent oxidoreductase (luciferase family)
MRHGLILMTGSTRGDVELALRAEAAGFDAFYRSDHWTKMGDVDGLPGPTDSWVTLGAIAR